MDDDNVVRTHDSAEVVGVGLEDALVTLVLGRAEVAAVSRRAVQAVVDTLRDCEELGVAFDHEPACVDPCAAGVGEQRLQHLGDAAAGSGRVDIQNRVTGERLSRSLRSLLEPRHPLRADQRLEPGGVDRLDVDFGEPVDSRGR